MWCQSDLTSNSRIWSGTRAENRPFIYIGYIYIKKRKKDRRHKRQRTHETSTHMHNKTNKTGIGLEYAMLNLINLHGEENCRVATVTLRGRQTMYVVGKKLTVLLNALKSHFRSIVAVCSLLEESAHVHLLLIMKDGGPTVNKLNKIFKAAKSKAKFGVIYDFEPIRTSAENVAGYFKKNYYEFMEARLSNRRSYRGRAIRMFNVPTTMKIDMDSFDSWNPNLANFRRALTRIAEVYGVEEGDEYTLSIRMRLPMLEIRKMAFHLVNTMAGKPCRWSESIIREAASNKRNEYLGRVREYEARTNNTQEQVGTADDFTIPTNVPVRFDPDSVLRLDE